MTSSSSPRLAILVVALVAACVEPPPGDDPPAPDCTSDVGVVEPLASCSEAAPCTEVSSTDDRTSIDQASEVPLCASTEEDRPAFDDGPPELWTDPDGVVRATCRYTPDGAGPDSLRPLVVFMHGAFGSADDVYDFTSLRTKAPLFDLTGDGDRPGFVLLSVQGRNLHWPTTDARDGSHHDIFHRDLGSPSANPDVANLDRLIDDAVQTGAVDPARIYLTGWSNGGFFAQLYAIARHERGTPEGNTVAGAAVFSAADPFHEAQRGEQPSCRLDPYPSSQVPLFIVGRACDLIACDAAQEADLLSADVPVAPGAVVGPWMDDLQSRVGDDQVQRRIINGVGQTVDSCAGPVLCGPVLATLGHVRWPDGVADGSGEDHEADMLGFLGALQGR